MISIIFWILAAICNAIMDTCSHHFNESVFFYNSFFDTPNSWRDKYIGGTPENGRRKIKIWKWKFNYPVQLTDSFHLFKMLMIVFICLSMAFYEPIIQEYRWGAWQDHWHIRFMGAYIHPGMFNIPVVLIVYGTAWNVIFNLFYNKILLKK